MLSSILKGVDADRKTTGSTHVGWAMALSAWCFRGRRVLLEPRSRDGIRRAAHGAEGNDIAHAALAVERRRACPR